MEKFNYEDLTKKEIYKIYNKTVEHFGNKYLSEDYDCHLYNMNNMNDVDNVLKNIQGDWFTFNNFYIDDKYFYLRTFIGKPIGKLVTISSTSDMRWHFDQFIAVKRNYIEWLMDNHYNVICDCLNADEE